MNRQEGWESRLNAVIEEYLFAPFTWGQNDCLLFMADCLKAMTGEDIMAGWRSAYDSEESAYALLASEAGGIYDSAFAGLVPVRNLLFAQRGDVGLFTIGTRDYCGVVGMDARSFLLRHLDGGLRAVPIHNLRLWRAE